MHRTASCGSSDEEPLYHAMGSLMRCCRVLPSTVERYSLTVWLSQARRAATARHAPSLAQAIRAAQESGVIATSTCCECVCQQCTYVLLPGSSINVGGIEQELWKLVSDDAFAYAGIARKSNKAGLITNQL